MALLLVAGLCPSTLLPIPVWVDSAGQRAADGMDSCWSISWPRLCCCLVLRGQCCRCRLAKSKNLPLHAGLGEKRVSIALQHERALASLLLVLPFRFSLRDLPTASVLELQLEPPEPPPLEASAPKPQATLQGIYEKECLRAGTNQLREGPNGEDTPGKVRICVSAGRTMLCL